MSSLDQSSVPAIKYSSSVIGDALRVVAKKNKRPDYSILICREVYEAIKDNTDHRLKSEVMGVLHHSDCIAAMAKEAKRNAMESYEAKYTPAARDKINYIAKWCSQRRGRYVFLAKKLRLNLTNLQLRMRYKMKIKDPELDRIYAVVMQEVDKDTRGANPKFGSHEDERFFAWTLRLYVRAMLDLAHKNISKLGMTDSTSGMDLALDWLPMEDAARLYKPYDRLELAKRIEEKGLILVHLEINSTNSQRFKLAHARHAQELYKLAFAAVQPLYAAGAISNRYKFSKTDAGRKLTKRLLKIAYSYYEIGLDIPSI